MANKIDYIKEDYNVGDSIRISCSLGTKEGIIVAFFEDRLKLQPSDKSKKPISVDESTITDWEEGLPVEKSKVPVLDNVEALGVGNGETTDINSFLNNQVVTNLTDDAIKEITTDNPKKTTTLKVGDKVDPSIIKQWEKENKERLKQEKKKYKVNQNSSKCETLKGLNSLGSVFDVSHINEEENKHVVREMGKILSFGGEFGFIRENKTGDQIWFGAIELLGIDPAKEKVPGMYVVYSRSFNYKGSTAVSIHKPDTIANLLILVDELAKNQKFDDAIEVLSHITSQFPDNYSAEQKKKEINKKKQYARYNNYDYSDNNYFRQAITYRQNKDVVKAIDTYKKAIENNQNVESSIKDLMGLYLHMLKNAADQTAYDKYLKETKQFAEQYVKKLSKDRNNLSHLENFYFALKDYDNFKKISKILLKEHIEEKQRYHLLYKNALVSLKEGKKDEAKVFLEQASEIDPTNSSLNSLFDLLDSTSNTNVEKIESLIDNASFFSFNNDTGRLSAYIEQTLDNYTEFAGVPTKVRDTGDFKKKDLNDLREFIANNFNDRSFAGRASDRARYLLTEGKLMQRLEAGETFKLRSVMARYCNDMAKIHIYESSSMDVVRFLYRESFYLESEYMSTARQVSYYLLTTVYDNKAMSSELGKNYSVDNALKTALHNRPFNQRQWEDILCMFLDNKNITAQVLNKIYDDDEFFRLSLNALKCFGYPIDDNANKDEFQEAWRTAITSRKNNYYSTISSLEILGNRNSIEEVSKSFADRIQDLKQDWMCPLDDYRLDRIRTEVVPVIEQYINAIGYRNKELYKHEVENLINKQIKEITENPTKLSFEGCLPLLKNLLSLITESFADIEAASEPVISINLERTENLVVNDTLTLQIEVSLDKDSSPINNVSIKVIDNKDIVLIDPGDNNPLPKLLEGGDKHTFIPTVKVSESVIENKAVAFDVICEYTNSSTVKTQRASLSLHLYKEEDFQTIYNPYAPVAESGPLKADSEMFYGHQRFIESIVNSIMESTSKQVIIFGQKRSGKSSVLNRVELGLQKANAFCIKFSMGKIVKNISECAFYYKILTELDSCLDDLRDDDEIVPEFSIPSKNDFQNEDLENPLETFTKYMRAFKKSCQKTEGWKDKRLVVLIDEFTYMYGAIKMGNITPTIMQQWKAITQDEKAQFSVVLVGQDVVPAFKNEPYARNAFGVIEDIRLSYLKEEDARDLIEKPIYDNGKSRYIGGASELIMDYTACNPYYIQMFCSTLVNYMNEKHLINITEADVLSVANSLTKGPTSLDKAKFENLLSARETDGTGNEEGDKIDDAIKMFQDTDVETVLYAIAKASQNTPWANRDDIKTLLPLDVENGILAQLASREVIEKRENDNILRIKVRLYKEWLLNH